MEESKLYRKREFTEKHPWASSASMAGCLTNSKSNGLEECGAIIREDRKVYIVEDRFIFWVLTYARNLKKTYLHYLSKKAEQ